MPDDLRSRRRPSRRRGGDTLKPNAIVASAEVLNTARLNRLPAPEEWQSEAWGYYDTVPEVRFACGWLANAMSRARLVAANRGVGGDEPVLLSEGPAADAVHGFAGGTEGQSQLLADATTHLTVPGIGYLIGEPSGPDRPDAAETWQVVSADELQLVNLPNGGKGYAVRTGEEQRAVRPLAPDALAVRLWRAHRRWSWRPDSPLRAALTVLRELEMLTQHIDASLVSRLAGAGVLFLPDNISFAVTERHRDADDPFVAELMDAMVTPIGDRDAASAVVPLVVRVPPDAIDAVKHLTFSTPLDEKAQALREEALRRFAAGMDMPAEVIMGMGDANHWTAWQIEEAALKLHVEPMLEAICHGLTVGYLHPALRAEGVANWRDFVVWYDTAELTVRPDRSGDAKDLFDRDAIDVTALRRETGFGDEDAPDETTLRDRVLLGLIRGAPTLAPQLLPYVSGFEDVRIVAPELPPPPGEAPDPADGPDTPDDPSGPNNADSPIPDTRNDPPPAPGEAAVEAIVAAADGIVVRALERVGARLANVSRRHGVAWSTDGVDFTYAHTVAPADVLAHVTPEELLAGAFDRVPEVAARYDVDRVALQSTLDTYLRGLIAHGAPHTFDRLREAVGA